MRDDYADKDQPCSHICILRLLLGSGHAYRGTDRVMPETHERLKNEAIKKREEEEAARLEKKEKEARKDEIRKKWEEQERKKYIRM